MQKIELLYNQSFTANTAIENFGPVDNLEPMIFKSQQIVNLDKDYYSYSNRNGVSIVNDLNVKQFLDKPENEKLAINFINYLKEILSLDEFRDLFYDNKKLAEFFNSYYNKFINYSDTTGEGSTSNNNIDLNQVKNSLFNQDKLYLKTNSFVDYDSTQKNSERSIGPDSNQLRSIPTDQINFTGVSENYYLDLNIKTNKLLITNTNFSEYFKDTCDGTINFKKYVLVNTQNLNIMYGNIDEILRIKSLSECTYGPSQESIKNLTNLLPAFFLNNSNSIQTQIGQPQITEFSPNLYFNNPVTNSFITLPQAYNSNDVTNFQGFNDFKNFFGFQYRPLSPNFNNTEEAKNKYIYTQIVIDPQVQGQIIKNPRFGIRPGSNYDFAWKTFKFKTPWPNNYNNWKYAPQAGGRGNMYRNVGPPEPLYQFLPDIYSGNTYRVEITTADVNPNNYIIVFLGLVEDEFFYYSPNVAQSEKLYGSGTFSFYLTYKDYFPGRGGVIKKGIGIVSNNNWTGKITEVNMYNASLANWDIQLNSYSPQLIGKKYDPLIENKFKLKFSKPNSEIEARSIVQYEYFSQSTLGSDDGFNSLNLNLPSSTNPNEIDEDRSNFSITIPTGSTTFEHEINIYKNFNVRNPIVFSLRDYNSPNIILSYLVIYLEEFYDLSTFQVSSQLNVTENFTCNVLYNGFVYKNYDDNFLKFYRPNNLQTYYDNGLGFTLQIPFSELNIDLINQRFLNYFNDNSLNIENVLRQLGIPENAVYNIYVNKPIAFEKIDTEFYYDMIIVAESSVNSDYIRIGNYRIYLYDPIGFQEEMNSFITINEMKNGLVEEKMFFANFSDNSDNKIIERMEFTTNISKSDFVNKVIATSDSQFMDAEKHYLSRDINKFKKRIYESLRVLVLGIQYVKFGKVTDLYAAQSYIMDLNMKFYDFQEAKDYFLPKLTVLKDEILSL